MNLICHLILHKFSRFITSHFYLSDFKIWHYKMLLLLQVWSSFLPLEYRLISFTPPQIKGHKTSLSRELLSPRDDSLLSYHVLSFSVIIRFLGCALCNPNIPNRYHSKAISTSFTVIIILQNSFAALHRYSNFSDVANYGICQKMFLWAIFCYSEVWKINTYFWAFFWRKCVFHSSNVFKNHFKE